MEISIQTKKAQEFVDITHLVQQAVSQSGIRDGIVTVSSLIRLQE